MDSMDSIYQENILDHYKKPHNFGEMKNPSVHHQEHNPLCGDRIEMFLLISDGKVSDVSFTGKGCAVSQASASMLTDFVKGKSISEIEKMGKEPLLEMLGITLSPIRLKCAMLSLDTIRNAIHIHKTYTQKKKTTKGE